jgi:hypothetical protein
MHSLENLREDDRLTVIAISAVAYICQAVFHEGGHAVVGWLFGAHRITMSTIAFQIDIDSLWAVAAGVLVNLISAALLLLLLLKRQRYKAATHYFLVLAMSMNLLNGTFYFLYSGVLGSGDMWQVIEGLQPPWLWRLGLVLVGGVSFYGSIMAVGVKLKLFDDQKRRLVRLVWTSYVTAGVVAGLAGLFNPRGLWFVLLAALNGFGPNFPLIRLPRMMRDWRSGNEPAKQIERSLTWIVIGTICTLTFIFVLGPEVTLSLPVR